MQLSTFSSDRSYKQKLLCVFCTAAFQLLIFCVSYGSGIRENVADVGNTREIHYDTLKAETEACVLGSAVLAEVEIPPIVLLLESKLIHTSGKDVKSLLTL